MNDSTLEEDLQILLEKGFLTQPTYEKAVATVTQFKKDLQAILSVDGEQVMATFDQYHNEIKKEADRQRSHHHPDNEDLAQCRDWN